MKNSTMKTPNPTPIGNHLRVALKHSALALAVALIASSGTARATEIYNFGAKADVSGYYPGPANAFYRAGAEGFTPQVSGSWSGLFGPYDHTLYFGSDTRFTLTADPGYSVTLQNFNFSQWNPGSGRSNFTVLDHTGATLATVSNVVNGTMASFAWPTLTDTQLTIVFGTNDPNNSGINNIKFSQQSTILRVNLDTPADTQGFLYGASITATATVEEPGAFNDTVTFHTTPINPPGSTVETVSANTGSPFSADLGALDAGTYEIYATVANNNAPTPGTAISATRTFTVAPGTLTTTVLAAAGPPTTHGENVTFSATVAPPPTGGTVQFSDGGIPMGSPATVNTTTGEATYSTTTLGAGTHVITAEYNGYQIYEPSTTASSISQEVNPTPACNMLSFNANLAGSNAAITTLPAATGSTVTVIVPTGTTGVQVADLAPGFTLSPFATCTQPNPGIPTPPLSTTTPVTYTVTAESGATKDYAVSVIVDGPPPAFMALTGDAPTAAGYWWSTTEVDGYQFTVGASDITVSWLGWYDAKNNNEGSIGDGFKAQIQIGLWQTSNGSLLAQATLNAGVVGTAMSGSFRGSGIAPITLTAGTTYTIAGYGTGGDRIHELSSTAGFTKNGVTIDTGIYGYAWPSMPSSTYGPLIGPNFGGTGPSGGGFSAWQTANNATGQTSDQDHDNDGVENGIEYFMGQTGSSFTAMPGLDATNKVSWTMDAAYQGTYEVQTSPDLVTWTNVDPKPTPADGTLSYTLPSGAGKLFVRLLVTPTP